MGGKYEFSSLEKVGLLLLNCMILIHFQSYINETFRLENFAVSEPDNSNDREGTRTRDNGMRGHSTEGTFASISQCF